MKHSDVLSALKKATYELCEGNNELSRFDEDNYVIDLEGSFSLACEIQADKVKEKSTATIQVSVLVGEVNKIEACLNLLANPNLRKGCSNYFFTIRQLDDKFALFLETQVWIWAEFSIAMATMAFFFQAIVPLLAFSFPPKDKKALPSGLILYDISGEKLLLRIVNTLAN
jgi:hypothetical protein